MYLVSVILLVFFLYSRCALEDSEAEMRFILVKKCIQRDYRYKDYNNNKKIKVYESVCVCMQLLHFTPFLRELASDQYQKSDFKQKKETSRLKTVVVDITRKKERLVQICGDGFLIGAKNTSKNHFIKTYSLYFIICSNRKEEKKSFIYFLYNFEWKIQFGSQELLVVVDVRVYVNMCVCDDCCVVHT